MPGSAPVATGVEFEALAKLEMTGAAIVNAARTAALIAADSGSPAVTMAHLVHATARQFRRESRVLTPSELGRHGALLQEALSPPAAGVAERRRSTPGPLTRLNRA